ncbi:MAG: CDP-alcohol phosphatidyltransferase family protein [Alphaproteobacteria bacterium]|nr:CDP-alcohol phosphatidyltransferase family protein [Alphaproteobacteria bacterium]MCW5739144.1 CDP-alcohol phosphatidyltransferase family protein [Alphaproteobacteria bacterium]
MRSILAQLPNALSLARLACAPAMVWAIVAAEHAAAFWIFLSAGLSDALDGFLAKRLNLRSVLGAYLDPIADKALLVTTYVVLAAYGFLPVWLVALVAFRDVVIVGGALLVRIVTNSLQMQPMMISKINTAAQIALAVWVLAELAFGFHQTPALRVAIYGVAATTVLSGAAYVVTWWRRVGAWDDTMAGRSSDGDA